MNLLEKAMRLRAQHMKIDFHQAGERSNAPLSEQYPVKLQHSANRFSPKLLIIGGIVLVLAVATISVLFESLFSPASPIQQAAYSDQPSPAATSQNTAPDSQQKISAVVNDWAKAWAAKDTENYLSFYAPEFQPPHGLARSAWEKQRRSRLSKQRNIEIALSGLTVTMEKDTATAEFVQSYKADGFSEAGLHKRLDLKLHGARWLIVKETSGKE